MIVIKCRVCKDRIVKGKNYPDTFLQVEYGVDVCDVCWKPDNVPSYVPRTQTEKYLILESRKNK